MTSNGNETSTPIPDGWQLVPKTVTPAWAQSLAEYRQGQSSTRRCEPPNQLALDRAAITIGEVLAAAPAPPVMTD